MQYINPCYFLLSSQFYMLILRPMSLNTLSAGKPLPFTWHSGPPLRLFTDTQESLSFPVPLSLHKCTTSGLSTSALYFHLNMHIVLHFSHGSLPLLLDYKLHEGTTPAWLCISITYHDAGTEISKSSPFHKVTQRQMQSFFTNPVQKDRLKSATPNQGQSLWMLEKPSAQKHYLQTLRSEMRQLF